MALAGSGWWRSPPTTRTSPHRTPWRRWPGEPGRWATTSRISRTSAPRWGASTGWPARRSAASSIATGCCGTEAACSTPAIRRGRSATTCRRPWRISSGDGRSACRRRSPSAVRSCGDRDGPGRPRVPCDPVETAAALSPARLHGVQELLPHGCVGLVAAPPERRPRPGLVLADATHLRAQVGGRQVDGDAVWLEQAHERLDDLHAHALLHREPAGEEANEPRQLRDADDELVRHVT